MQIVHSSKAFAGLAAVVLASLGVVQAAGEPDHAAGGAEAVGAPRAEAAVDTTADREGRDVDPATVALAPFSAAAAGAPPPAPWQHRTLPRVPQTNRFALVEVDGRTVLQVRSEAAASTLVHPLALDPQRHPLLNWRWQVSNPVAASDFTRKDGDDYAGRVYVLFDYPTERLPLMQRLRMALARNVHGTELPTAAIAYVWGSAQPAGATGPNPYTDRVQMIVVESGAARAGQWVTVRRDVAADFEAVFGEPAPAVIGVAVGADTDNTGEAVTTLFGDLWFAARDAALLGGGEAAPGR